MNNQKRRGTEAFWTERAERSETDCRRQPEGRAKRSQPEARRVRRPGGAAESKPFESLGGPAELPRQGPGHVDSVESGFAVQFPYLPCPFDLCGDLFLQTFG